jgi:pilus assembly protein CpaB
MMRNRIGGGRSGKAVLLLALFLGLISAVLVYVYLSQAEGEETAASDTTKSVVVAMEDMSARVRITAEMVEVKSLAESAVHPDAFSSTDQLIGMVTRLPIAAGEQILSSKVATTATAVPWAGDEELPLSYVVPPDQRALSVQVSEVTGAGGLILPGDFVDVIGVFDVTFYGIKEDDPTSSEDFDDYVAVTVLQNVQVLAVAQEVAEALPGESDDGDTTGDESQPVLPNPADPNPDATNVTLAVTPADAQKLALAEEMGVLKLSLRPVGDTEEPTVPAITNPEILPSNLPSPFGR